MHVNELIHSFDGIACWDFAAVAAHSKVDFNPPGRPLAFIDCGFVSPHKLLGGPGTPGILLLKKSLMRNAVPSVPGEGWISLKAISFDCLDRSLSTPKCYQFSSIFIVHNRQFGSNYTSPSIAFRLFPIASLFSFPFLPGGGVVFFVRAGDQSYIHVRRNINVHMQNWVCIINRIR